jgi:hypothetical protein
VSEKLKIVKHPRNSRENLQTHPELGSLSSALPWSIKSEIHLHAFKLPEKLHKQTLKIFPSNKGKTLPGVEINVIRKIFTLQASLAKKFS